jgi:hypothetical protein
MRVARGDAERGAWARDPRACNRGERGHEIHAHAIVESVGTRSTRMQSWRAWARDPRACNRGERGKAHHTHHANHAGNPTRTHGYHAHHSETQAARTHSTGGIRIAANGGAYAHSGSMHQDGRRCMEVGTSNRWYTETASKQPAAHPPEPQNPAIQPITTGAYPPVESNQKNPAIHLITTGAHPPVESNQKTPEINRINAGAHPRQQSDAHRAQRRSEHGQWGTCRTSLTATPPGTGRHHVIRVARWD